MNWTQKIRTLGNILIILGILIFAVSAIVAWSFYVLTLIQSKAYFQATAIVGTTFISIGYALRKIFRPKVEKL